MRKILYRLLIAISAGIAVAIIIAIGAWHFARSFPQARNQQWITQCGLRELKRVISNPGFSIFIAPFLFIMAAVGTGIAWFLLLLANEARNKVFLYRFTF